MRLFAAVTSAMSLLAERLGVQTIRVQGVLIAARSRTVGHAFQTEQGMSGSNQDIFLIYRTRSFITVFTKSCNLFLCWAF